MNFRRLTATAALLCITGVGAVRAQGAGADATNRLAVERIAVGTCDKCHGWRGHSIQPKFPVLAAQQADYLLAQLHAFKAQTRGDPDALGYLWGMAAPLEDDTMTALADYYSRQAPWAGERGDPRLMAHGEQIYQNGD